MDFEYSPRCMELREKLNNFMDKYIYPNERTYKEEVDRKRSLSVVRIVAINFSPLCDDENKASLRLALFIYDPTRLVSCSARLVRLELSNS